jgi:hypothetical protein
MGAGGAFRKNHANQPGPADNTRQERGEASASRGCTSPRSQLPIPRYEGSTWRSRAREAQMGHPVDLARGTGVLSLPKSRKQASENGKDCRVRKRTHKSEARTRNLERKVANSAAPAHVHSSHAAHKAPGAAACIATIRPHRAGLCGLRCALPTLPSRSPGGVTLDLT